MKPIDEILYNALLADSDLTAAVGGRIKSTCFEVSPDEPDNTPLPSIIVTDDGMQAQPETKDCQWMPQDWRVQASIEVSADSPRAVRNLIQQCARAVAAYVETLGYEDTPQLDNIQTDGITWDWMKPCYYDRLHYQCTIYNPA